MIRKVLIIKEEGIGNAIMSVPLIKALRYYFPKVQIDVLCSNRNKQLLDLISEIDNLYVYNRDEIYDSYDVVINTQFNSKVFVKYCEDKTEKVVDIVRDFTSISEAERNLEALSEVDIIDDKRDFWAFLNGGGSLKRDIICIHTGCYDSPVWWKRKWFNNRWIELINRIDKRFEINLIGCDGDCVDAYEICSKTRARNLTNLTTLKETAELLGYSRMLISIDSGMVHLSTAVRTPAIALYGCTSEIKSRPYVPEGLWTVIRVPMICERCYINDFRRFKECTDNVCMKSISVDMVLKEVKKYSENISLYDCV